MALPQSLWSSGMAGLVSFARKFAGKYRLKRFIGEPLAFLLETAFPSHARTRLLIYHHSSDICWSLVYPFFHYADRFEKDYGLHTRLRPIERFFSGEDQIEADIVLVQPWLDEPAEKMAEAFARYRERHPDAQVVFIDSFANTDTRFGHAVAPSIDLYLRKALFRDRSQFRQTFAGDTNLMDYYAQLYGLETDPVDWQTPEDLLERMDLLPNFLTAPYLVDGFLGPAPAPGEDDRPIDLHNRIATNGTPWYSAMREHAREAAQQIPGIRRTRSERIGRREFLDEIARCKLCWSPFGYGELCWRDLEAIMKGAVLVKPDMSHLETAPDLYRPGETYLPVKWDFSDLEEVVQDALHDPERRAQIAANAFAIGRDYLASGRFVTDMAHSLELEPA